MADGTVFWGEDQRNLAPADIGNFDGVDCNRYAGTGLGEAVAGDLELVSRADDEKLSLLCVGSETVEPVV